MTLSLLPSGEPTEPAVCPPLSFRKPASARRIIDLARLCARLSARIDPAECLRLSYGEALLSTDPTALEASLASAIQFFAGLPRAWISIDAYAGAQDWISVVLVAQGSTAAPLHPFVGEDHAPAGRGLAGLEAPSTGYLTIERRAKSTRLQLHMPGHIVDDDPLEAVLDAQGLHYAVI